MNKTIRRASVVCLLLVLALLVRATWLQVYDAKSLADNKFNRRQVIAQYAQPLGDIIVAGSSITGSARTAGSDLAYKRTYVDGPLYSAVTGFSSQSYGATQLEGIYANALDGTDSRLNNPLNAFLDQRTTPGDVLTTIDPAVQKAGYNGLGNKTGAAVAIDPTTGRVLAVVSTPSYDPTRFSGTSQSDADAWTQLTNDKSMPLLNRALRQPLPPGSTFKLVVAAAALQDGLYPSIDVPTKSPNPYVLPGTVTALTNESAADPCLNATMRVALEFSCNTVFAKISAELGPQKINAMAKKFGFNNPDLEMPVRAAASVFPTKINASQTALSGIGQFDTTATPLQMAMVSATISNGGVLDTPHMVSKVVNSSGDTLQSYPDGQGTRVISASIADQLRSAMETVVQSGTGTPAQIAGATVGGKTGTAQHGVGNSGTPFAWFTSWAKDKSSGKEVAVAVVVEQSDAARAEITGGGLAGPIAQKMMKAALQ